MCRRLETCILPSGREWGHLAFSEQGLAPVCVCVCVRDIIFLRFKGIYNFLGKKVRNLLEVRHQCRQETTEVNN